MSGPATAMDASGLRGSLHTQVAQVEGQPEVVGLAEPAAQLEGVVDGVDEHAGLGLEAAGDAELVGLVEHRAEAVDEPAPAVVGGRRPSGRTPDQHDIASAPSSAAMRTARAAGRSARRGRRR